MNLISVIPLTRQKVPENLSYFTASDVPIGAIVSVPLRSKTIHAIVVDSRAVMDAKAELRGAPFQIRKLSKIKASVFFPETFVETCRKLSAHYASTIGSVIVAVTPELILENASKMPAPMLPAHVASDETFAVQGDDEDRVGAWRSLIRQEFARKKSVAIYVPTVEEAKDMCGRLSKGIEGYIFMLHGRLTKKEIVSRWKEIALEEHPIVVIATGLFSLLPRSDIETVIIERENGRGWISQKAPYLDLRRVLEAVARANKQSVYLSDCMLRLETLERLNKGSISQGSPFKWRSVSTADDILVDMIKNNEERRDEGIKEEKTPQNRKGFRTISPELENLIRKNLDESTHLFIYTLRRGLSTMTVCDDCETVVVCAQCSAPVVLHAANGPSSGASNFFMCHRCGTRRSAEEVCVSCGGWRLTPLGVGIDRVATEIRELFPDIELFQVDADSAKTPAQIERSIEGFRNKPGGIILGTEQILNHLKEKVEHVAVASMDSLFSLPDFRIPEKIMYTLVRLRTLADRTILVQTRRTEERVFEYGLKGNLSDFCRGELEERRRYGYPPAKTLIKLTIEGKKDPIALLMADIRTIVEPYDIDIFPAFTSTVKGNSIIHGLIKADPAAWPDADLIAKLRSLPPNVSVKVDPESLL